MKGSILVRPNLKLFILAAILLIAVQDLVTRGHSQSTTVQARGARVSEAVLQRWIAEASQSETPDVCMRLSDEYYRRGETRRALFFLRRAEQLAEAQD